VVWRGRQVRVEFLGKTCMYRLSVYWKVAGLGKEAIDKSRNGTTCDLIVVDSKTRGRQDFRSMPLSMWPTELLCVSDA
jgi:hypothetical protein